MQNVYPAKDILINITAFQPYNFSTSLEIPLIFNNFA